MSVRMWNGMPILEPDMDIPTVAKSLQGKLRGEFCLATSFESDFVARLIREGFLTMAERVSPGQYLLLPKLHVSRCILHFPDLRIQRHTRRAGSQFDMTMDQCFQEVVRGCVEQHGENWLHPPLQKCLAEIHRAPGGLHGVRLHSVEVWEGDRLVAGEIGSSVGTVYTSFTGFSRVSSSGAVQCAALPLVLQKAGFTLWDLGMSMTYKIGLGAHNAPRAQFLKEYRKACETQVPPLQLPRTNAAVIFKWAPSKPTAQANPSSKRQQKKRARMQRRLEAKAKKREGRAATVTTSPSPAPPPPNP
eukprot:GGOE01053337.1.p1 GENE.GGOE01053337.1~~GGOE01053337.1.p1  ORF type:complete len:303 (-),score=65.24 GGOE01053337.1:537-1445(-)